tara:strand:- start:176 stop:835 length:660 start_codon:yes stop_codon:yes gene_type:complete
MAYGKIIVQGLVSENSDYSNPYAKTRSEAQTETPTEHFHQVVSVPTTPGMAVDFSDTYGLNMPTVSGVAIRNRGTTNDIMIIWYSFIEAIANPGGSGITFAASAKTITDAASGDSFANVEAGEVIHSNNASNSSNRNSFLVVTAADNLLTLSTSPTDSSGDTTATFIRMGYNKHLLKPGRWMVLPGEFADRVVGTDVPREIYLVAQSGASEAEIFAFGA